MNAVWQHLTLMHLPTYQWRQSSLLWRGVGLLGRWQRGSWLLQWSQEIAVFLLSLLLALAPFVPNTLIGLIAAASGAFWLLLTLAEDRSRPSKLTPIHLLVLLFWGIALVATALSPVKTAAFSGLVKLTLYLGVFALLEWVVRSPRWRSWLIAVYLNTALLVSVEGVRQWLFGAEALATWTDPTSPLANTTRVYSFLGNPNLLAGYLIPAIPLSLVAIFAWRGKVAKLLGLIMVLTNTACLGLTFSRGGWIGLVAAILTLALLLLFWVLPQLPAFWRVWTFPILLGTLGGILLLGFILVEPLRERVFSIFASREDSSNNFRLNVWAAIQRMISDRPLLGIGPGNTAFNKIYPLYQHPRYPALSAYSIYLEIMVETGLIGFACFLWLLVVLLQRGWLQLQALRTQGSREGFWLIAAIATLAGMLAHGTVDTVWYRPEVATLWWFMVALISSYWSAQPASIPQIPQPPTHQQP